MVRGEEVVHDILGAGGMAQQNCFSWRPGAQLLEVFHARGELVGVGVQTAGAPSRAGGGKERRDEGPGGGKRAVEVGGVGDGEEGVGEATDEEEDVRRVFLGGDCRSVGG